MVDRHVDGPRLSAFLDDELQDDDAIAVAHHVHGCPSCLGELEALRATRDALRNLPRLQAPLLTAGIERRSARGQRVGRAARRLAVAMAVPLVMLGAAYALGTDRDGVEPPTDLFLVDHLSRTGGGPVPAPLRADR